MQLRGKFYGFALEAAKKLSEYMEINVSQKVVGPDRIRAVAGYKAPDPAALSHGIALRRYAPRESSDAFKRPTAYG